MDKTSPTKKKSKESFADWEVGDDYEIIKLIGKGSYGSVVEAV